MKREGLDTDPVILLYQMGKVGSTSVWETLVRSRLTNPIYKVHYLSDAGVAGGSAVFAHLVGTPGVLPHSAAVREVRALLADGRPRAWKVISLVRDPIARDVSSYLQLVHFAHPGLTSPTVQEKKIARAAAYQFALYDEARSHHARWFDIEVRAMFGIDAFATPFDHERRRLRVRSGNVDLLVLRVEDLADTLSTSLASFLDADPADIPAVYASSRHPTKVAPAYDVAVYRRIVAEVRVPRHRSEPVYASRFARHFYTDAERAAFAARWAG
jgi:hypothetical protein